MAWEAPKLSRTTTVTAEEQHTPGNARQKVGQGQKPRTTRSHRRTRLPAIRRQLPHHHRQTTNHKTRLPTNDPTLGCEIDAPVLAGLGGARRHDGGHEVFLQDVVPGSVVRLHRVCAREGRAPLRPAGSGADAVGLEGGVLARQKKTAVGAVVVPKKQEGGERAVR